MAILHVANGHATTGLIEQSEVPGRTMVWADPLYDGPVPGHVSEEELLRIRAGFLASGPDDVNDVVAGLEGWRAAIDDQASYDELVLWFEHDLFDQLNLIQLLTHLGQRDRSKPVTLVMIDRYPGHPNFKGIGELEPSDMVTLFASRQPVADGQFALAPHAWAAYRSADPRAIEVFLAGDTSALPFLGAALRRHLEEFPSDDNGLSKSERRMMDLALSEPVDIHRAFARMSDGETAYYITDRTFLDRAHELSSCSPPLLALTDATMAVTSSGRKVLSGAMDRVVTCGLDRWLGGAHVEGRGPVWRWSSRAGRVIEA